MCVNILVLDNEEWHLQRFIQIKMETSSRLPLLSLSILMEEILTLLLKKALEKGRIGNLFHLRGSPLMSHLFYVVDLLVFSIDEKRFMRIILNSLEVNGSCSGKAINKEKSALFLSKKISNACQRSLLHVTGFVEGNFSTKHGWGPTFFRMYDISYV